MRMMIWIYIFAMAFVMAGCGGGSSAATNQSGEKATDVAPVRKEVVVDSIFQGTAMVGEQYVGEMSVTAVDARNSITSITVENPTSTGAKPTINAQGDLVWTPNAADFSTRELKITVASTHGGQTIVMMPARVGRKQVIHRIPIDAGEGNYSDSDGDFMIRVYKDNSVNPVGGVILVVQRQINDGGQGYEYEVEDGVNYNLEVLEQPSYQSAPRAGLFTQSDGEVLTYGPLDKNLETYPGTHINPWREKNIWTERLHVQSNPGNSKNPKYFNTVQIGAMVGGCQNDCKAAIYTKEPVILMHGFTPGPPLTEPFGGGEDTWGELPATLIEKGHPVFEVRWRTYMRFEEAAYLLKLAVDKVSNLTGKKPVVIAHSFGGIAAHLAAQGKAERYSVSASAWKFAPTDQIAKIITINSPLSGISGGAVKDLRPGFSLAAGRDANDLSISVCKSVTCFQAGEPVSIEGALVYLGLNSDGPEKAGHMAMRGSVIEKLQKSPTLVPNHVIVGLSSDIPEQAQVCEEWGRLPLGEEQVCKKSRYFPRNFFTADYGDGLISLLGQAKHPADFIDSPFESMPVKIYSNTVEYIRNAYGITYPWKNIDILRGFNGMSFGKCLKYDSNGTNYRLCRRMTHTNTSVHRQSGVSDFGAPFYEKSPEDFTGQGINHPLHDLVVDAASHDYLLGSVVNSCDAGSLSLVCQPKWQMKGQVKFGARSLVTQGDSAAPYVLMWLTFEHKTTGQIVRDFSGQTGEDGAFTIDLATPLRERVGADVNPADYRVKLKINVQGYETYLETIEDLVPGDNQLSIITLKPKQVNFVNIIGKVIDGQTESTGIASAVVRLVQGSDLDANTIRNRTDVANVNALNNARKLTTAADGSFTAQGLRPGIYSILVSKDGYVDQLQGRVTVSGGGNISLSMLHTLPAGENSITLRWDNGSAGAAVASDLDSHLLRLNGSQLDYHIYYGRITAGILSAWLDRDDVDYEGPETVTFASAAERNFVYYVHNFSGLRNEPSTITDSRARVTLRYNGRTLQFSPPITGNLSARYWRVFDIINGNIVRCVSNCLQDVAPTGLATQAGYAEIPAPWRSALTQLPTKH